MGTYVLELARRSMHLGCCVWMCFVLVKMYVNTRVGTCDAFTVLKWIICLRIHAHVDMLFVLVKWVIHHFGLCERILPR